MKIINNNQKTSNNLNSNILNTAQKNNISEKLDIESQQLISLFDRTIETTYNAGMAIGATFWAADYYYGEEPINAGTLMFAASALAKTYSNRAKIYKAILATPKTLLKLIKLYSNIGLKLAKLGIPFVATQVIASTIFFKNKSFSTLLLENIYNCTMDSFCNKNSFILKALANAITPHNQIYGFALLFFTATAFSSLLLLTKKQETLKACKDYYLNTMYQGKCILRNSVKLLKEVVNKHTLLATTFYIIDAVYTKRALNFGIAIIALSIIKNAYTNRDTLATIGRNLLRAIKPLTAKTAKLAYTISMLTLYSVNLFTKNLPRESSLASGLLYTFLFSLAISTAAYIYLIISKFCPSIRSKVKSL